MVRKSTFCNSTVANDKERVRVSGRFDELLHAMATQPEPSGTPARGNRTSGKARGADCADTQTRADTSEDAFSTPTHTSP